MFTSKSDRVVVFPVKEVICKFGYRCSTYYQDGQENMILNCSKKYIHGYVPARLANMYCIRYLNMHITTLTGKTTTGSLLLYHDIYTLKCRAGSFPKWYNDFDLRKVLAGSCFFYTLGVLACFFSISYSLILVG